MVAPVEIDELSLGELRSLVAWLLGEMSALKAVVAEQRDEIARLKGLKCCPAIKPSGLERAAAAKLVLSSRTGRRRGKSAPRAVIKDRVIKTEVPAGLRLKGYEDFIVQGLVLRAVAIRYRRERWLTLEGKKVLARLPGGIAGYLGPHLGRFVLQLHHQGQVTVERITTQLHAPGLGISKRQVMRLLIGRQHGFLAESCEVPRAGLHSVAWIIPISAPMHSLAPAASMASRTPAPLWLPRLSITTMSPGRNSGASTCST